MNKVYREIAFEFAKLLNKLGYKSSSRDFISIVKADEIISLLFKAIFDKIDRDGKAIIKDYCIIRKIECKNGKYYLEIEDKRKK